MGVTEMWVSRRFRGMTAISVEELAKFAKALECDVRDLLPSGDISTYPALTAA